jgi:hypothetical protein
MSRSPIAFASADISALARSLREQLKPLGEIPSHVAMLNMLARAGGYRNFQHLKAEAEAARPPAAAAATATVASPALPDPVDVARVARVAGAFGPRGELLRWPSKTNHQELCLWVLWARYPAHGIMDERGISAWLNARHEFGDAALLRRTLVTMGLVTRTQDGREYRRVERKPPADLVALLARLDAGADR